MLWNDLCQLRPTCDCDKTMCYFSKWPNFMKNGPAIYPDRLKLRFGNFFKIHLSRKTSKNTCGAHSDYVLLFPC